MKRGHSVLLLVTILVGSSLSGRGGALSGAHDAASSLTGGASSAPASASAQAADPSLLTLDRIYASREFASEGFSGRWAPEGSAYFAFERSSTTQGGGDFVKYDAETGRREVVVPAARFVPPGASAPLRVEDYQWSPDGKLLEIFTNSQRAARSNTRGDYWVLDVAGGRLTKLGGTAPPSSLMFAKFSPDGSRVGYVRENNLWMEDLRTHRIWQLTAEGSKTVTNGAFDWVYEEELGVRDGWRWSPDGRSIAFWQLNTDGVGEFAIVNDTDSTYPKVTWQQYPKVGEQVAAARIGVVSADGGATMWMQVPGNRRDQYIVRMEWAGPNEIAIERTNRAQNTLDVLMADATTGRVRTILTEKDAAWVDAGDPPRWIDNGKRFVWVSERDGWRHIYVVPREGGEPKLVTAGSFDAAGIVKVDEPGGWIYYLASPETGTERYLFRSRLDGQGKPERVTPPKSAGTHGYQVSADGRFAVHTFSDFDTPPVVDLVRLPQHSVVRTLADNAALRAKVAAFKRTPVEFMKVDIGEGIVLDGWCMKPPDMKPGAKYPLLVYVYGEPASQTVVNRWGGNTYLWHLMLAQHGYVVVSVDNQGTPSLRGRAWRKAIYKQIGILSSKQQAAAVRKIAEWPFVDGKRIGVWGWSGGGSMTLNAMFRYPDLYNTGLAGAAVPDQTLYNTVYQERYMGLYKENQEAYREGSPLTYAHQLKGNLLFLHGTGDDNVHYQGAERLVNALVKANKLFTFQPYPNRTHGITEGENTSLHVRETMTRFLEEHMPPGPR